MLQLLTHIKQALASSGAPIPDDWDAQAKFVAEFGRDVARVYYATRAEILESAEYKRFVAARGQANAHEAANYDLAVREYDLDDETEEESQDATPVTDD